MGVRSVEAWEVEAAITEKTSAIAYFVKPANTPPLEDVIKIGKAYGVPVILDAAAELPPISNLGKFISLGASSVSFSGGKAHSGPSGLGYFGRKEGIDNERGPPAA